MLRHQAGFLRKTSAHPAEMESPEQCVNGPTQPPQSHVMDQGGKQVWAKSCVLMDSQAQTHLTF